MKDEDLIPMVLKKGSVLMRYNPNHIYDSLRNETDISKEDAKKITIDVSRFVIASNIKHLTAPLIREIVNTILLKYGFEVERLQYTRIGLPFYDLVLAYEKQNQSQNIYEQIFFEETLKHDISKWVDTEFRAVIDLIEQIKSENVCKMECKPAKLSTSVMGGINLDQIKPYKSPDTLEKLKNYNFKRD